MTIYIVLAVVLGLWGLALWSRGFFGKRTPALQRRVYAVRLLSWGLSILIVAWPLELYRRSMGEAMYIAAAVGVLAVFFAFGHIAARLLGQRQERKQ